MIDAIGWSIIFWLLGFVLIFITISIRVPIVEAVAPQNRHQRNEKEIKTTSPTTITITSFNNNSITVKEAASPMATMIEGNDPRLKTKTGFPLNPIVMNNAKQCIWKSINYKNESFDCRNFQIRTSLIKSPMFKKDDTLIHRMICAVCYRIKSKTHSKKIKPKSKEKSNRNVSKTKRQMATIKMATNGYMANVKMAHSPLIVTKTMNDRETPKVQLIDSPSTPQGPTSTSNTTHSY